MKVLIVGGAGYIGGVTTRLFEEAGHAVTVFDNLSTGHKHNLKQAKLVEGDMTKPDQLASVFKEPFDAVLCFAAKIQVGESMTQPYAYFMNNSFGALNVIDELVKAGVKNFIFSSTAAVYGEPKEIPITESSVRAPINAYGASKVLVEYIMKSYEQTHGLNWTAFRYFNAAGAYGGIGPEYPKTTHIIPKIIEAYEANAEMTIFGNDYKTADRTCVRDYVHVEDIARAHVLAAELMTGGQTVNEPINLGSGHGYSNLEVFQTFNELAPHSIKYKFGPRRPGDPDVLVASNLKAKRVLDWQPKHNLSQIVTDALEWHKSLEK